MVDVRSVEAQLKRIKFNRNAWGRAEIKELPHILNPEETLYECVNGIYDGGFALLVATDLRILLIDKKPLNYLTVEDLRFDMINEIDYSHRLLGARITINTGSKTMKFTSYNQPRLRKLINHVQDRMSEIKRDEAEHQDNQRQHLAQINQQLQAYLLAQHQQLMQVQQQGNAQVQPIKPSPELADYLFAQSLMQQFGGQDAAPNNKSDSPAPSTVASAASEPTSQVNSDDLLAEGYNEIFGKAKHSPPQAQPSPIQQQALAGQVGYTQQTSRPLELNALRIASAKLPMMLRNRKFGRPSFRAHSHATTASTPAPVTTPAQPAI